MKLKEAIELGGGTAYGMVKCTYTLLKNSRYRTLFSVVGEETNYDGAFYRITDDERFTSGKVDKYDRLPIVMVDEQDLQRQIDTVKDNEYQRVRLTDEFRVGLKDYLDGVADRRMYKLFEEYKRDYTDHDGKEHKKGTTRLLSKTYDYVDIARENAYFKEEYKNNSDKFLYWVEATKELKDRYKELLRIVTENDYVYVFPRNIDWVPADIVITFVDDRNTITSYEAQLNAAKEKVEQAKRLLIASGLASLII